MLRVLKKLNLTRWIFIGLIAGIIIGQFFPNVVPWIKPFRALFINGIKCIIAPLIFSTIVSGIAGAGNFKTLGRIGLKAIIYFEIVTTLALAIGLFVVNVTKPGLGIHLVPSASELPTAGQTKITLGGFIEHLLPTNFADAIVRGDVLQIVIFSTIFAMSLLAVGSKGRAIVDFCESLSEVMFKFTGYIMLLAPLGVGAALASSVQEHGISVILPLFRLVGSLYLALILFVLLVLVPICFIFRIPPVAFFKEVKDAFFLAFATTSSESAYPLALRSLETFGVPRSIASFVLPMGYSFNLDGSTLYLALASIFIAQAAGINLGLGQQLTLMLTLMLTTKGVAAVPRASLVVLSGTLTAFGLPLEGITLILGVDEFMDMARTSINLLGNCVATAAIARTEGIELAQKEKNVIL